MKKPGPHVASPYKVWIVEGKRKDNGNGLYYTVWADNAGLAQGYLRKHLLGLGVEAELEEPHPLVNGRYEQTINCKINHPLRYEAW